MCLGHDDGAAIESPGLQPRISLGDIVERELLDFDRDRTGSREVDDLVQLADRRSLRVEDVAVMRRLAIAHLRRTHSGTYERDRAHLGRVAERGIQRLVRADEVEDRVRAVTTDGFAQPTSHALAGGHDLVRAELPCDVEPLLTR